MFKATLLSVAEIRFILCNCFYLGRHTGLGGGHCAFEQLYCIGLKKTHFWQKNNTKLLTSLMSIQGVEETTCGEEGSAEMFNRKHALHQFLHSCKFCRPLGVCLCITDFACEHFTASIFYLNLSLTTTWTLYFREHTFCPKCGQHMAVACWNLYCLCSFRRDGVMQSSQVVKTYLQIISFFKRKKYGCIFLLSA